MSIFNSEFFMSGTFIVTTVFTAGGVIYATLKRKFSTAKNALKHEREHINHQTDRVHSSIDIRHDGSYDSKIIYKDGMEERTTGRHK